ncbi:phage protein [Helicobacter muridarum]|nr:phage protein [Helicobacter muridarum]
MQCQRHKSTPAKSTCKTTQLCKIKSFGAGKKIRGTNFLSIRPDLIICDDIENDENTESKTQRDKLYKWFNKAILKLPSRLNPHYNIVVVGTTLHYDSLLQRISQRNDFATFNFPLLLQMPSNLDVLTKENLATFKPKGYKLDDEALNIKEILSDYLEDKASFYSEFQNEPLDKDNAPLSNYTTYTTLPKELEICVIGIDPSLGKSRSDYFALSTLFYDRAQKKLYASSKGYKLTPDKMIDKILSLYIKTQSLTQNITIACESVAFQEFFKDELKKRFQNLGIFAPIIGIKNTQNKAIRLDSLAPLLSEGDLLIYEQDNLLKEELDTYPKCPHDDLLDSIDIAKQAMNTHAAINYKVALHAQKEFGKHFRALKDEL